MQLVGGWVDSGMEQYRGVERSFFNSLTSVRSCADACADGGKRSCFLLFSVGGSSMQNKDPENQVTDLTAVNLDYSLFNLNIITRVIIRNVGALISRKTVIRKS